MTHLGVVGGGTMGAGIAEVAARAGDEVLVLERDQDAADAARARIEKSLARGAKAGKITEEQATESLARLRTTTSIADFGDRELVIEALPEIESLKVDFFSELDQVTAADAILATNTSSIPIIRVAKNVADPSRVVGVHFFNPVPVMPLVEIIASLASSTEAIDTVTTYARDHLGKRTIQAGDRGGFVVNALLIPYLVSAIRMYESGYATKEDIDAGMINGCAHPMGPLTLSDTVGLDVVLDVAESLYQEFREPHLAPPPLLQRMVDAGYLGKKAGKGFYDYSK
ncbi:MULTISPECIES: 3-hydroxybutyryl-CoA dehydrogenase [Gordonia]|uniref:3-hydroxybutyryl-CoA dehydrogenase n=1 Tax=Gordonia hankookensis TaxID=589403 RepID=A0ABR7WHE0_9ACTN|nr:MULTISPECIES: 3-hydroxybutyryl-CoA dehydrogenase [Gordonia]MBD1322177.1 3-hydroxybutyryl-CoA dehydrogenase [Gordonia hankookensis]NDZ96923.1 3-hydroxybutyryl-CoA dehydrogenase [Streptomyces sp. SID11726]NEB26111.1 3-hydroxybutyryl-CoA dehydrogenase [Streptomyces sp. SID6673]WAC55515.1 3-hydroxybutyryl-CoA dehydrogenase [Gordonia sp. SL306]